MGRRRMLDLRGLQIVEKLCDKIVRKRDRPWVTTLHHRTSGSIGPDGNGKSGGIGRAGITNRRSVAWRSITLLRE
jgi:ribosomal protein L15